MPILHRYRVAEKNNNRIKITQFTYKIFNKNPVFIKKTSFGDI